jgi:hypothetical protein
LSRCDPGWFKGSSEMAKGTKMPIYPVLNGEVMVSLVLYNWQNSLTLAHFSSLQTLVTFKLTAFAGIAQYL